MTFQPFHNRILQPITLLSARWMLHASSFFFPSPWFLSGCQWLVQTAVVLADVLCYLLHKQKWQIPSRPEVEKTALYAASYAARHLSFYNPIMYTHMKHVRLRSDKWHSIGNRCAEMWQGQTTRRRLVLKIWIINVRQRWHCFTIHHTSSGSHWL